MTKLPKLYDYNQCVDYYGRSWIVGLVGFDDVGQCIDDHWKNKLDDHKSISDAEMHRIAELMTDILGDNYQHALKAAVELTLIDPLTTET